jgi:hypothetical protein
MQIETMVVDALRDLEMPRNQMVAGGDTTFIDAEYQAFILACRRCLDQLTFSLSALFKQQCTSFREFGGFLLKQKNKEFSEPLMAIYAEHSPKFHGWLLRGAENRAPLRDLLAHQRSISAGTLNVTASGITFVGMETPTREFVGQNISPVVQDLFVALHACVERLVGQATDSLSVHLIRTNAPAVQT